MRQSRTARRAGLALALLLAAACAPAAPAAPPNVVLIAIDTLRADRLGAYGSTQGLTPFLDGLAAQSVVFTRAYAPSSWTCPSVASLFTSRHPSQHRISRFESKLADSEATLAESLARAGYTNAGFTANSLLSERLGYGQGFHVWVSYLGAFVPQHYRAHVRARFLWSQAVRWLDTGWKPEAPRPVFLYLHFMDPHTPYNPPGPFRRRFALDDPGGALEERANAKLVALDPDAVDRDELAVFASLYDGSVAYLDAELRRFFDALGGRRFLENALVVVTADHGEEFREHGRILHGFALFEESVRVPLLIRAPGLEGGLRIEQPVSLVDVAPTILDWVGIPPEAPFEGRSLVALMRRAGDPAPESAPVLLELPAKGDDPDTRGHAWGGVQGSAKVLVDPEGRVEEFDLARDPAERSPAATAAGRELAQALRRRRAEIAQRANPDSERVPLEEAEKRRLRELGYAVE